MNSFHKFNFSLLALAVTGYFVGHLLFHGIKTVSYLAFPKRWLNGSTSFTTERDHPFNIAVINMDLLQGAKKNIPRRVWSIPHLEDRYSRSVNRTNKVWVVTPTYRRANQIALLTRLAQALYPVRHFVSWIVIDEYEKGSDLNTKNIEKYLKQFSIPLILKRSTPRDGTERMVFKPKGVDARNDALRFFRHEDSPAEDDDVVYFADDDNGYDSEIFYQMRDTEVISMWPTGVLTPKTGLSSPVVRNGKLVGFFDGWVANRKIPVDFAMFAISVRLVRNNPYVSFQYVAGYIETLFLQDIHFLEEKSLENDYSVVQPMAKNCTEILTWHTKHSSVGALKKRSSVFERAITRYNATVKNINSLYKNYYLPLFQ